MLLFVAALVAQHGDDCVVLHEAERAPASPLTTPQRQRFDTPDL